MTSRRLARLMRLVCEIKAGPGAGPDGLARRLGVSRRQLYKDREALEGLGFAYGHSRREHGPVLVREARCPAAGLGLAQLFALMEGARALAGRDELPLALAALDGLGELLGSVPEPARETFARAVDELVAGEGMGCRAGVLRTLRQAVAARWRVGLLMAGPEPAERIGLDPRRLVLRGGRLFLEAEGLGLVELAGVREAAITVFRSPREEPCASNSATIVHS